MLEDEDSSESQCIEDSWKNVLNGSPHRIEVDKDANCRALRDLRTAAVWNDLSWNLLVPVLLGSLLMILADVGTLAVDIRLPDRRYTDLLAHDTVPWLLKAISDAMVKCFFSIMNYDDVRCTGRSSLESPMMNESFVWRFRHHRCAQNSLR
jgi:hypothetical protein